MKKCIITIFSMVLMIGCFTACGLDVTEVVNYADEQLHNQPTGEIEAGNDGFNLESAITGALEEEGVSTISDEGTLCFDVPEGYVYYSEYECYISPDSSVNIYIEKKAKNGKVIFATDEAMEIGMEDNLKEQMGYDVDVTVSDMAETTVDGYEGAYITYEYMLDGNEVVNKQILVVGDKYHHVLAFIYHQGAPYADDWEAIKETVRFE